MHDGCQLSIFDRLEQHIKSLLAECRQDIFIIRRIHHDTTFSVGLTAHLLQKIKTGQVGQLYVEEENIGLDLTD